VGGQHHALAALLPGKTCYPLYRRLGGSQDRSGQLRKISPPLGFDPRTVQPVASRCIAYAIPAHFITVVATITELEIKAMNFRAVYVQLHKTFRIAPHCDLLGITMGISGVTMT
jgi:hypothetical protein